MLITGSVTIAKSMKIQSTSTFTARKTLGIALVTMNTRGIDPTNKGGKIVKDRIRTPTLEEASTHNEDVLRCIEAKDLEEFSTNITTACLSALQALLFHYAEGSDRHTRVADELKLRA